MKPAVSCPDVRQLLDESTPEQVRAELEKHIEVCPICRDNLLALEAELEKMLCLSRFDEAVIASLKRGERIEMGEVQENWQDDFKRDFPGQWNPDLQIAKFGDFYIEGKLGGGGMGVVYKARDSQGDEFALKVMSPKLADDNSNRHRFLDEAQAVRHLQQKKNTIRIIKVHFIGEDKRVPKGVTPTTDKGVPFFTMDLLHGETLGQFLRGLPGGKASLEQTVQIGVGIALALEQAKGFLVHRDLKPSNIWITDDRTKPLSDRVILFDFGIIKKVEGVDAAELERTGTALGDFLGTPPYMAPEGIDKRLLPSDSSGSPRPDHRYDLFSLGTVLYEIISGRSPFVAENETQTFIRILNPQLNFDSMNDALALIIKELHHGDPLQRIQSGDEVARRLRAITQSRTAEKIPRNSPIPDTTSTNNATIGARRSARGFFVKFRVRIAITFILLLLCGYFSYLGGVLPHVFLSEAEPTESDVRKAEKMEIESPRVGASVGGRTAIHLKDVYIPKGFHLWACEVRNGDVWPKAPEFIAAGDTDTDISRTLGFGGEKGEFELTFFMVPAKSHWRIKSWLELCGWFKGYPPLEFEDLPGRIRVKSVKVVQQ